MPESFVNAGILKDPATNSLINDEVASIRATERVQNHRDTVRHIKEDGEEGEPTNGDSVTYIWRK